MLAALTARAALLGRCHATTIGWRGRDRRAFSPHARLFHSAAPVSAKPRSSVSGDTYTFSTRFPRARPRARGGAASPRTGTQAAARIAKQRNVDWIGSASFRPRPRRPPAAAPAPSAPSTATPTRMRGATPPAVIRQLMRRHNARAALERPPTSAASPSAAAVTARDGAMPAGRFASAVADRALRAVHGAPPPSIPAGMLVRPRPVRLPSAHQRQLPRDPNHAQLARPVAPPAALAHLLRHHKHLPTFAQLGLTTPVVQYMEQTMHFQNPTAIQTIVVQAMAPRHPALHAAPQHMVLISEPASGKTHAYMLPVMEDLTREDDAIIQTARAASQRQSQADEAFLAASRQLASFEDPHASEGKGFEAETASASASAQAADASVDPIRHTHVGPDNTRRPDQTSASQPSPLTAPERQMPLPITNLAATMPVDPDRATDRATAVADAVAAPAAAATAMVARNEMLLSPEERNRDAFIETALARTMQKHGIAAAAAAAEAKALAPASDGASRSPRSPDDMFPDAPGGMLAQQAFTQPPTPLALLEAAGRRRAHPRAVIVVPTRDLVDQTVRHWKRASHHGIRLRTVGLHMGQSRRVVDHLLAQGPIDVLVGTPNQLVRQFEAFRLFFDDVRWLVLDEADTLLDRRFAATVGHLMDKIGQRSPRARSLFLAGTMPRHLLPPLKARYDGLAVITSPRVHRLDPAAKHQFVATPGGSLSPAVKQRLLLDVLRRAIPEGERIVIFTTRRDTADDLVRCLNGKGIRARAFVGTSFKPDARDAPRLASSQLVPPQPASSRQLSDDQLLDDQRYLIAGASPGGAVGDHGTANSGKAHAVLALTDAADHNAHEGGGNSSSSVVSAAGPEAGAVLSKSATLPAAALRERSDFLAAVSRSPETSASDRRFEAASALALTDPRGAAAAVPLLSDEDVVAMQTVASVGTRSSGAPNLATIAETAAMYPEVMVATDVASLGLDLDVGVVVNYDMPPTLGDYLRRAGRTCRTPYMGMALNATRKRVSGRVITLVTPRNQKMVEDITWALRHRVPLA
ncbi:hypothetical protein CXG81DRAFT_20992 [Caulochytrium protostelioides]|uniref:Helicase ATP-binding domain-containing protein n=1 Tax=Caulochytrium protostelioides TaxID=1555241 RepID=A0A4P9X183_9FUNG|nr:hypothetical protein CXG81DRAFT_20992 [Caulochytrium protostelioides]|eukprot:RKO98852.1 hypothetical protein CXG81DRAFT_20992 [Caulochytrium protostelioides]